MPAGRAGPGSCPGLCLLAGTLQALLAPAPDHVGDAIRQFRRGDKQDEELRPGGGGRQDGRLVRVWRLDQPFRGFRHVTCPHAGTG